MRMFVILALAVALVRPAVAASTPNELVQELNRAAQGDFDGFIAAMSVDTRHAMADTEAVELKLSDAQKDFALALDRRFGANPLGSGGRVVTTDRKALLSRFVNIELIGAEEQSANRVQLHLKTVTRGFRDRIVTEENILPAVNENGEWKLDLTGVARSIIQTATQRAAIYRQITQDIRSNTYKDRIAALIALTKAQRSAPGRRGADK
jgi:hypothetical protein